MEAIERNIETRQVLRSESWQLFGTAAHFAASNDPWTRCVGLMLRIIKRVGSGKTISRLALSPERRLI